MGAPYFNQKFFTAEFDKAATERPSHAKGDAVGEYIAGLHNISPEVANVMLDTVKSNFTLDWRASKYTGNGVQFYSELSKLVEQAHERANEIKK